MIPTLPEVIFTIGAFWLGFFICCCFRINGEH